MYRLWDEGDLSNIKDPRHLFYKTNNTHLFVRALIKLPTLPTFETVQTPSAIASGMLDCSKGTLCEGNSY